jgi:hypothetical protein
VDGGERNAGLEGEAQRDDIAVVDVLRDRLAQRVALVCQR